MSQPWGIDHPFPRTLREYRESFLKHFKEECPYIPHEFGYELIEVRKGIWEELYVAKSAKKDLKTRIRLGNPVKEILAESQEEESVSNRSASRFVRLRRLNLWMISQSGS